MVLRKLRSLVIVYLLLPAHVADGNFRLKNGSASINVGVIIADINDAGSASSYSGSAPDLGAYEYGGTDWSAGSIIKAPPDFPIEGSCP